MAGAIGLPDWMDAGEPPIISMHSVDDAVVLYDTGPPLGAFWLPPMYGGLPMHNQADAVSIRNTLHTYLGDAHPPANPGGNIDYDIFSDHIAQINDFLAPELECSCNELDVKVFLEGAMLPDGSGMRADLPATGVMPAQHPYAQAPYNFNVPASVNSFPADAVDWILVELRSGTPIELGTAQTVLVEQAVGFLLADGSIVNPSGQGALRFTNLTLVKATIWWFATEIT